MKRSEAFGFAILLSFCLAAWVFAQEQKVNRKGVPAAVSASAAKAYPNARIEGWSKETEDGKTYYEAEMIEGQTKRDVIFLPDGKIDLVGRSAHLRSSSGSSKRAQGQTPESRY